MTILSACQLAAIPLVGRKPTTIFSSTKPFETELSALVQTAARDIAKARDWQALTVLVEHQGDGVTVAFPLPEDYDRLPLDSEVHSASWQTWKYHPVKSLNDWLDIQTLVTAQAPGYWSLLENRMQIYPPMASTEKARYYYISANIARDRNGIDKPVISADTDTFRLDENLLTLSLIWRWRALKRLEYAEDMANYERELAKVGGRDRGASLLAVGRKGTRHVSGVAYPGVLG